MTLTVVSEDLWNSELANGRARARFRPGELRVLLRIYSSFVVSGVWKDYALSLGDRESVFEFYGRSRDMPAMRLIKRHRGARAVFSLYRGSRKLSESPDFGDVVAQIRRPVVVRS